MGLTDPNIIFSCTKNELDAIREGLYYRAIEERENLVELAFNLRYTLNAKKADFGKLSKKKDREKVRRLFRQREERGDSQGMLEKIERLNEHFRNR
nr:MAG TPA: hypothetical protein [Caudoviricetes sp.]DAE79897.1 MAG TPA: hypothetical protein [Caudoviricetes sp.]DAI73210.1 MAG TPA: hypothetical protein [Caudoviricetes sp.]DAJ43690.1 MAG TPA: hypothetical protein [Caudoviricetes sp.]DAJ72684.1 MAG TPA: hypothetical protein [Caudoviricetes sp.]